MHFSPTQVSSHTCLAFHLPEAPATTTGTTKSTWHKKAAEHLPRGSYLHEGVDNFCLQIKVVPDYFLDHLRPSNLLLYNVHATMKIFADPIF